jgi:hypothetical protein
MAGELLKDWAARKYDYDVFNTVLSSTTVRTIYAGSATSEAGLNSTDAQVFGASEIGKLQLALNRMGAIPLKVTKVNGRSIPIYGCVFGEVEEYRLGQNTTLQTTLREALARVKDTMGDHPLFRGAIGMYKNMILYPYYSLLPIPQGTALRPECIVYGTLATATTTVTVGSIATAEYTLNFASAGSLQIGSEIISYTGKTNTTFTGCTRGVSSTSAAQYSDGALVTQRNVASVIGFGAEAICRAMPEDWTPIGEKRDYGAQTGLGIEGYYGHALKLDQRLKKPCGVVVLKVYSENPGTI